MFSSLKLNLKPFMAECANKELNDVSQDAVERIHAMKRQEKLYFASDYLQMDLQEMVTSSSSRVIDVECRARMSTWCIQAVDYFKLSRETAYAAMSCFDRFLSTSEGRVFLTKKSLFQLACVTSLHIAIKVHEPVELDLALLVQMCRGGYTAEHIICTEQTILHSLQWVVNPTSPKAAVHQLVKLLPESLTPEAHMDIFDLACHQADLALSDYYLSVLNSPLTVALSSILNACSFVPEVTSQMQMNFLKLVGQQTRITRDVQGINESRSILLEHLYASMPAAPPVHKKSDKTECRDEYTASVTFGAMKHKPILDLIYSSKRRSPVAVLLR
jgi:hypothetical protein